MSSRRTRWPILATVALALLASLGLGLAGDALVHTDDGCAVEVHCLTCQRVAGSIAVLVLDLPLLAAPELREPVRETAPPPPAWAPRRHDASRGPPPPA